MPDTTFEYIAKIRQNNGTAKLLLSFFVCIDIVHDTENKIITTESRDKPQNKSRKTDNNLAANRLKKSQFITMKNDFHI